jgi:hypothetical protein
MLFSFATFITGKLIYIPLSSYYFLRKKHNSFTVFQIKKDGWLLKKINPVQAGSYTGQDRVANRCICDFYLAAAAFPAAGTVVTNRYLPDPAFTTTYWLPVAVACNSF